MSVLSPAIRVFTVADDPDDIGTIYCIREYILFTISFIYNIPEDKILLFDYFAFDKPPRVPISVSQLRYGMLIKVVNADSIPNGA
ncbi:hypothetical protein NPIL_341011 [Nephila pilipes]|uniref:Uncharacterized protein n=1 Tax=Nephila pilipes TaxID=299642 RepID=A0A8X6QMR8_NEPPI|nr:hypothetical protein NPIL_341011 [Nephila pilipes]